MTDSLSAAISYPGLISARALAKSGRVLCAFSYFYFPFYSQAPHDIFWQFDPFAWLSSFIYDIDEDIEDGLSPEKVLSRLGQLGEYLDERIIRNSMIDDLFNDACRYYQFEHDIVRQTGDYSLESLVEMTYLRSFDFRLMHHVLAQKSGQGYKKQLFDWFKSFEMLMEMEDDISSVEKDTQGATFNIVCLAQRHSQSKGLRFVEQLRQKVESDLITLKKRLPNSEQALCVQTLETYRRFVQRPLLIHLE